MRRLRARLAGLLLAVLLAGPAGAAERVADLAVFRGIRPNPLVGYGLVVGLPGTGDDNLAYTVQSMRSAAAALGVQIPPGINTQLKNTAVVMLTAELPPFAKPGQRLDVSVSALGRAKSLRGGTLLLAPLRGPDGETYALAQGQVTVGGFGAEGADGSRLVVNIPSSGRIPGGALVERAVPAPFGTGPLVLDLHTPSFFHRSGARRCHQRRRGAADRPGRGCRLGGGRDGRRRRGAGVARRAHRGAARGCR